MLVAASRSRGAEAHVYNMPGTMAEGADLVAAIESTPSPTRGGLVDFDPVSLPFPVEIDHDGIEAHRARAVDLVRRRGPRERRDLPGAGGRGPARRGRARPRGARLDVACLPARAQTPPSPGGARRSGQGAALPGATLPGAALAAAGDPPGAALAAAASISPPSAAAVGSPGCRSWPLIAHRRGRGDAEVARVPGGRRHGDDAGRIVEAGREARDVDAGRLGDRRQPVGREPAVVLAVLVGVDPVRVVPVAALVGRAGRARRPRSSTRRSACGRPGSRCRGGRSAACPARRSRPTRSGSTVSEWRAQIGHWKSLVDLERDGGVGLADRRAVDQRRRVLDARILERAGRLAAQLARPRRRRRARRRRGSRRSSATVRR